MIARIDTPLPDAEKNFNRPFKKAAFICYFSCGGNSMKASKLVLGSILAVGVLAGGILIAQGPPERNVSGGRHPNIAAAQRLTDQAYNKISAAQNANEWDMDGHAAKAKDLLDQANRELKAAAMAANRNRR